MRLRSEVWIQAYFRRVQAAGAAAYVVRRGDRDAGAILISIASETGTALLAPAMSRMDQPAERRWAVRIGAAPDSGEAVAEAIDREVSFDPDIWVIEVEDRDGRHFLDDEIEPS